MNDNLLQWIEIDSSALDHNIKKIRTVIGADKKLLVLVKANAYGHGIVEISRLALKSGADWLGVHSIEEGILLRKQGFDCPILIVGYVPLIRLEEAVKGDLKLTVYNIETIERLASVCHSLKKKAFLHLKLETGTHRQGINKRDVLSFVRKIKENPYLVAEGISSHFANIEDTTDHSYAKLQKENFNRTLHQLEKNKIAIPLKHMSCTASAILFKETHFNMVRTGIGIYGLWPSKQTYLSSLLNKGKPIGLKPVLSWKTRIAQIKDVPEGAYIGYGCTYRTTRRTKLAVLPVGYYDGYSRSLSNRSHVIVKGKRAPLRGRVAMNFIVVDVTDIEGVQLEDEAVLLGKEGKETVSADYLASLIGTINYEIVTRINPKIPRIVK